MFKSTLFLLTLFFQLTAFGQIIVQDSSYYELKFGVYTSKSTDSQFPVRKTIKPQIKLTGEENTAFLKVGKSAIQLFDKINDAGNSKPVAQLTKTSVVRVDTVFYREIYKDTTKEWFLTFNVWYAITINGKHYYTDAKIHDLIAYWKKIRDYKQEFLLIAQNTGYDELYDSGYPNNFFVVILNEKQELMFESDILELDFGNEYWEDETVEIQMTKNGFEWTLHGLGSYYKAIWTGKEMTH